ncbi:MAG: hypothetical protein JOZ90_16425 [Alphaproteobacteria bacterium]|nr:hypothetical protein [Alphaproteobacteria bacterium]MBV9372034.1 hypothetical protein [Alphaproteobacteria bacterium]MBV9902656.1 hypothetical protein [Alphaproteobacteria bacterium]
MRLLLAGLALLLTTAGPAGGQVMRLTIYDDGLSCPAGCDAHVVANPADNGGKFVSDPASPRTAPRPCVVGRACRICFGDGDETCMSAVYRGGGPSPRTIDATPAFYAANCGRSDVPAALAAQCAALDRTVSASGYDRRVDCLGGAADPRCAPVLASARALRARDVSRLALCRRLGEARYNAGQADPRRRRALDCLYSKASLGGPNSRGTRWRILLPAACRPGTFVGRDGLDCCPDDRRFAAGIHPECSGFFLKP